MLGRKLGRLAASLLILLAAAALGCAGLGQAKVRTSPDGVTEQSGRVAVACGGQETIRYPVPYASAPHLRVFPEGEPGPLSGVRIAEQTTTHFTIQSTQPQINGLGCPPATFTWEAKGVRAPGPGAAER